MLIEIKNPRYCDDAIISSCYLNGNYFCMCIENKEKAIKQGEYIISKYYSPKFNKYVPLLNVPFRQGIEIHSANYGYQLRGCLAMGLLSPSCKSLVSSRYWSEELTRLIFEEIDKKQLVQIKISRK